MKGEDKAERIGEQAHSPSSQPPIPGKSGKVCGELWLVTLLSVCGGEGGGCTMDYVYIYTPNMWSLSTHVQL